MSGGIGWRVQTIWCYCGLITKNLSYLQSPKRLTSNSPGLSSSPDSTSWSPTPLDPRSRRSLFFSRCSLLNLRPEQTSLRSGKTFPLHLVQIIKIECNWCKRNNSLLKWYPCNGVYKRKWFPINFLLPVALWCVRLETTSQLKATLSSNQRGQCLLDQVKVPFKRFRMSWC